MSADGKKWNYHVQNSSVVSVYITICTVHETKIHLKLNIDIHLKFIVTRFRRVLQILLYIVTDIKDADHELICPLCRETQEKELCFVLCYPVLSDLRAQFIPSKLHMFPIRFRLSLLLASNNENIERNLSFYLYKGFKLRSSLSS